MIESKIIEHNPIYLLADSLALPRPPFRGSQAVSYQQTYPYLLRSKLKEGHKQEMVDIELIVNAQRARTMPEAASFWGEVELFRPSIAIIQIGIVDCAPRVFSRRQRTFVERIRPIGLRSSILSFVESHRRSIISVLPGKVYTPPIQFSDAALTIAKRCFDANIHLCFVSIAPSDQKISDRSPGIQKNIHEYNGILNQVAADWHAKFIDLHSAFYPKQEDYLLDDGHHLGIRGHIALADLLAQWVDSGISTPMLSNK